MGIKETEKKINLIMLGVAVELLLKAVFVKKGYLIFKIEEPVRIKSWEKSWNMNRTIEASKLIDNLQLIMHKRMKKETIKRHQETLREIIGLKNKETHSIGGTYGKGDREYIELIRLIITMAGKII